jgi:hypothetical protein
MQGLSQTIPTTLGYQIPGAVISASAQQSTPAQVITYYLPLERAAELLEQRYAIVVTDENPVQVWPGELGVRRRPNGIEVPFLKEHSLALPPGLTPEKTPKLDAPLLRTVVEAYHQQNPDQPRFQVLESKMGLHIVPVQVHDESGKLVPATNPLDAQISVPVEKRTASEHMRALCDAVTASAVAGAGSTVKSNGGPFDQYYAANGYLLPRRLTGTERPYMLFEWGTSGTTARDALIDLMDGSASSMTWHFGCGPAGQRTGLECFLNMMPLMLGPEKRIVSHDRCKDCKPVPGALFLNGRFVTPPGR